MQTVEQATQRRAQAGDMLRKAGIYVTPAEQAEIETADFGLNQFEATGLGVLVYVNTDRCCAKERRCGRARPARSTATHRPAATLARKRRSAAAGGRSTCTWRAKPPQIP